MTGSRGPRLSRGRLGCYLPTTVYQERRDLDSHVEADARVNTKHKPANNIQKRIRLRMDVERQGNRTTRVVVEMNPKLLISKGQPKNKTLSRTKCVWYCGHGES